MKRDMELIRRILAEVEDSDIIKKFDRPEEAYNIALAKEAGLVEAEIIFAMNRPSGAFVHRLTWAGHDFLDAARNDTLWNKAKEKVIKPGMSWSFSLLLDFLKAEAKHRLFGALGLPE